MKGELGTRKGEDSRGQPPSYTASYRIIVRFTEVRGKLCPIKTQNCEAQFQLIHL